MRVILTCGGPSFQEELARTLFDRTDLRRLTAGGYEDGLLVAIAQRPRLLVLDSVVPRALQLIQALRQEGLTREMSIAVVGPPDIEPGELGLLDGGANALLRRPAGPAWDDRLARLLAIPLRRAARLRTRLEVHSVVAGAAIDAAVLNLSRHGMLIETNAALPPGADVSFALKLWDGPKPVTGVGHVVRVVPPHGAGIGFDRLDGDGDDRIRRFVNP